MKSSSRLEPVSDFPGYWITTAGVVWSKLSLSGGWKQLKASPVGKYLGVWLRRGGRTHAVYVHHLVLLAYVGPRPDGMECIHKNDKQTDNRLVNLKWGTHKENCTLRRLNGMNTRAKLTDELVRWILRTRKTIGRREQARHCKVSVAAVDDAYYGRTWKHIER